MHFYIKNLTKQETIITTTSLINLGAADISITDNSHLEGHQWEISFVHYNLKCQHENDKEYAAYKMT